VYLRDNRQDIRGVIGRAALFSVVLATVIGVRTGVDTAHAGSRQARPSPNTRDGIHIFYDQPPFNLTPAQQEFMATHYVGCQKTPIDLVDAIRGCDDDFIVLNYRLAFGTYDTIPGYLSGDQWINDWELEMNRLLDLERRGRIVICQPIAEDEWAVGERMYNLASYLLIKGEKTHYNLVFGENFYDRLIFFPECLIDLGPYADDIPERYRSAVRSVLGPLYP